MCTSPGSCVLSISISRTTVLKTWSSSRNVFLVLPAVSRCLHHLHHQRSTCVCTCLHAYSSSSLHPTHLSIHLLHFSLCLLSPPFCHSPLCLVLSVFFFSLTVAAFCDTYPLYLSLPSSLSLSTLSFFLLPRFLSKQLFLLSLVRWRSECHPLQCNLRHLLTK